MKEASLDPEISFRPRLGLCYDPQNPAVSLDYLKADYSTAGRGDFGLSFFDLEQ
jgi:hypothetical protein